MEFTTDANGDLAARYGRIDLDDYINVAKREGLVIKEIHFQFLNPITNGTVVAGMSNTGIFTPLPAEHTGPDDFNIQLGLKTYATTTAYTDASEVGIGSPDVLAIEELSCVQEGYGDAAGNVLAFQIERNNYGVTDLHPSGFPIISDLLVGVAMDTAYLGGGAPARYYADATVTLDVMIVAAPKTFTIADFGTIIAQQQDL